MAEIQKIRQLQNEYGLNVSSIGSPIGKVKLVDVEDGTKNVYVPFEKYLAGDVQKACELAHAFETKLVRGFSFYPPKGSDPRQHVSQVVDHLGHIAEAFHRSDLTFGLEVEANLVGSNGLVLAEIYRQVNHPGMVLIFDAGNILPQGFSTAEVFEQYLAMKPGLGWIHIKDYRDPERPGATQGTGYPGASVPRPSATKGGHVEEDKLANFVPADLGDSGHERILRDFRQILPAAGEQARPPRHPRRVPRSGSRTSRAAGSSAASAGRTEWVSPSAACAACWTTSASTITFATSTTCGPRGDSEPV